MTNGHNIMKFEHNVVEHFSIHGTLVRALLENTYSFGEHK